MNTPIQPPNVLALPPLPPAPINTVMFAIAGLVLSAASVAVYYSISGFPANAPVESVFAALSSFVLLLLGFVFGLKAVMNETKRTQFAHVVERYTNITGDRRYLPYVLPIRVRIVTPLFIVTVALPVIAYAISLVGDHIALLGANLV